MEDRLKAIKDTFVDYSIAFNSLEPTKVLGFFHLPAMLMTSKEVAIMQKEIEVLGIFKILMDDLKDRDFEESKIVSPLKITQLSENQGQVVAVAKRFNRSKEEIEHFGFTYTLRKVAGDWKIISGVLHDPETFSNS
jgi:hypothetical protein